MWLWLLTQTALQASALQLPDFFSSAFAEQSSSGPASDEEAAILWKDGESAFKSEDYAKAIPLLRRLVDRYPGKPGFLEAHRYLGRAYLFSHEPGKSVPLFEYYITAAGDRALGLRTRIWLAEAFMELNKNQEALLSTQEVENAKDPGVELFSEAELLKARALLNLNEDERAGKVYDAVREKTIIQTEPELKSQAELINLEVKQRECSRTSSSKKSAEELEVRRLYQQRALCLQEMLVQTKAVIDPAELSKNALTSSSAVKSALKGFQQFNQSVKNPPSSPQAKKQTALQNKQYKAELIDILEQDRLKAYRDADQTITSWMNNDKTSAPYKNLSEELQKLSRSS